MTLSSLDEIYSRLSSIFPNEAVDLRSHLAETLSAGISRKNILKFAALFHDSAKPFCAKKIRGKMRFLGHETKGSSLTKDILRSLKAGNDEIKITQQLIENHMRPISLGQARVFTDRAFYRLYRDLGANTPDLALLSLADCYSYRGLKNNKTVELKRMEEISKEIIQRYFAEVNKPKQEKLVDGHMIMKKFKLKPGPKIGKILKLVHEAAYIGKIKNKNDAFKFIAKSL
jgi:tRNA nucleotidyltransferase/poly(A) polymerase